MRQPVDRFQCKVGIKEKNKKRKKESEEKEKKERKKERERGREVRSNSMWGYKQEGVVNQLNRYK